MASVSALLPITLSPSCPPWRPYWLLPAKGILKAQSHGDEVPAFLKKDLTEAHLTSVKGSPRVQRERTFSAPNLVVPSNDHEPVWRGVKCLLVPTLALPLLVTMEY